MSLNPALAHKAKEFRLKFYETAAELEEEQGKNLKLHAQIKRDYENSSSPFSKASDRKRLQTAGKNRMETRWTAKT